MTQNTANYEMINMSIEDTKRLKRKSETYKKGETFFFKGKEFLKDYADYMVQYLEIQYGKL